MTKPRFKLDENLSIHAAQILREGGYDAVTVNDQVLGGSLDQQIGKICIREGRCLITGDLHFSNILAFPPQGYPGIIVLRHPRMRLRAMLQLVHGVVAALQSRNPRGDLWIVEPHGIRIHSGTHE